MSLLASGFVERGHQVDLLLARAEGPYLAAIPPQVRIVEFGEKGVSGCLLKLARYLRRERPDILVSAMSHVNVVALLANRLAGSPSRVVISERTSFASAKRNFRSPRDRATRALMRLTYRWADRIVVVASAIVDELAAGLRLNRSRLVMIPSPLVPDDLAARVRPEPDCAEYRKGKPVILAAGRLTFEKDFHTLLRAFALLRTRHDAALVILGEGSDRASLMDLARELGVEADFALPGFVSNPFPFMRAASLFVLSSCLEGMPGVLVQAMACGTPVVSTDCRTGPREILEDGRWGALVPVGNPVGLADAMMAALARKDHPDVTQRAKDFSEAMSIERYLEAVLGDERPESGAELAPRAATAGASL